MEEWTDGMVVDGKTERRWSGIPTRCGAASVDVDVELSIGKDPEIIGNGKWKLMKLSLRDPQ